jgi:pimeloyl-ACP methyl ester carboxylesterase
MDLQVWKAGKGFPILCLHGHPGSGRSMAVFTEPLSRRFRTIAPDLRGYGKSKTHQDFSMTEHLQDLERVLDREGIDRCLILGWSLGGILGLELAARFPERIRGLILVATSARPWGDHPRTHWKDDLYTGIAALLNVLKPGWQWNIDTFGKRSLFRYLIQQHTPETYQYIATNAVYAYLNTSRAATRALSTALRNGYQRVDQFEQITCPSLMLIGEHDRHIMPASSLETAQALPNCEWKIYPQTAHLLPWERPAEILHDLEQWLDRHPEIWQ